MTFIIVQPTCFSFIQLNVTKPRLEGKIVRHFLANQIYHYHRHRVYRESDKDGCGCGESLLHYFQRRY